MNWIVLHEGDGAPVRVNMERAESYHSGRDGLTAVISAGGNRYVTETPEEIDRLVSLLRPSPAPIGFLGGEIVTFGPPGGSGPYPARTVYHYDGDGKLRSIAVEGGIALFDANHQPIKA